MDENLPNYIQKIQEHMNNKVLIQTLTQIPDISLLQQLSRNINNSAVNVPDLNKLFRMFSFLLKQNDKKIIFITSSLAMDIAKSLLMTQVQILWKELGNSVILILGAQDVELRRKAQQILWFFLDLSKNAQMILQTIYYEGLEHEQSLVILSCSSILRKLFQKYNNILQKKSNIAVVKLIIEKMIMVSMKENANLSKCAKQFLHSLFFANLMNFNEVLERMDSSYIKILQKIWQKDKQDLLYKNSQDQQQKIKQIQYQHLPMIKDKFFGVYQPFVIKNLFSSQTVSGRKYAAQQFQKLFIENQQQLSKFINLISKIILRALPNMDIQIVQLLNYILHLPGISNIVNLSHVLNILISQLSTQSVPYRKVVRSCLERLNTLYSTIINTYNQTIHSIHTDHHLNDWILVYEMFSLIIHWMHIKQPAQCYPPSLNQPLLFAFKHKNSKVPKIKQKCSQFLFDLLQRYPSYRQTLQDCLSQQEIGQLQDQIEERKNYLSLNKEHNKEAKMTFKQYYDQQRRKYIQK